MIQLLALLLLSLAHAQSQDWVVQFTNAPAREVLGADVTAALANPEHQLAQVLVSKLPIPSVLPKKTEPQWQDFVVAHLTTGKGHLALKKALVQSPHTAYISEMSYNRLDQPMMAKVLVIVEPGTLLMFRYEDAPTAYAERNKLLYRKLFQDLAFGRREDLIRQILSK